jgi:hypothetical protein
MPRRIKDGPVGLVTLAEVVNWSLLRQVLAEHERKERVTK